MIKYEDSEEYIFYFKFTSLYIVYWLIFFNGNVGFTDSGWILFLPGLDQSSPGWAAVHFNFNFSQQIIYVYPKNVSNWSFIWNKNIQDKVRHSLVLV